MSVKKALQHTKSVARAVRSSIVKMTISKPLELGFQFVLMAGITEGIMAPIQEQEGPNSWHHLSRAVFLAGFATNLFISLLADTWMKLQQNEQSEGHFGEVPTGKDAEKSYFRWWFKKTFRNKDLSLLKSHAFSCKLIWANMPAALTMYLITNTIAMGRFDLDMYAAGYALAYGDFLGGFEQQVDQGFEQSLGYDAKDFPENLRLHPKVVEYLQKKSLGRRARFSMVYDIFYQMVATISGTIGSMTTARLGSRSLSRWLFGGYSLTELTMMGLDRVQDLGARHIPMLGDTISWCQHLISNGYTDWQKYRPQGRSMLLEKSAN